MYSKCVWSLKYFTNNLGPKLFLYLTDLRIINGMLFTLFSMWNKFITCTHSFKKAFLLLGMKSLHVRINTETTLSSVLANQAENIIRELSIPLFFQPFIPTATPSTSSPKSYSPPPSLFCHAHTYSFIILTQGKTENFKVPLSGEIWFKLMWMLEREETGV